MVAAVLFTFREGLETALIIGIVLDILRRIGMVSRMREVWNGTVAAVIVSLITCTGIYTLGVTFEGRGEEIFEGISMILAACVLTWMICWMQDKSKNVQDELEEGGKLTVATHNRGALFGYNSNPNLLESIVYVLYLVVFFIQSSRKKQIRMLSIKYNISM